MTKANDYLMCDKCLHLLTAIHFTNTNVCDICTRKETN